MYFYVEPTGQTWLGDYPYRSCDLVPDWSEISQGLLTVRTKYDIGSPPLNRMHWTVIETDTGALTSVDDLVALVDLMLKTSNGGTGTMASGYPKAQFVIPMLCTAHKAGTATFGFQVCNALEVVNFTAFDLLYVRAGYPGVMKILARSSRMIVGIHNTNEISLQLNDDADADYVQFMGEAIQFL